MKIWRHSVSLAQSACADYYSFAAVYNFSARQVYRRNMSSDRETAAFSQLISFSPPTFFLLFTQSMMGRSGLKLVYLV